MTTCRQPDQGLTIEPTQPLHQLLHRQYMPLLESLYDRSRRLEEDLRQCMNLLRELQAGRISLEQIKVADNGFEIRPTKPPETSETVKHDPEAGSDNGAAANPVKDFTTAR